LVGEIAPEVGEEWVSDDDIEFGAMDEAAGVGEEGVAGANGFGSELQLGL